MVKIQIDVESNDCSMAQVTTILPSFSPHSDILQVIGELTVSPKDLHQSHS